MINAILTPIIREEMDYLKIWLKSCPPPGRTDLELYLSIDSEWLETEKNNLLEIIEASNLKTANNIVFINCEIEKEQSFYKKEKTSTFDVSGFPYGAKSGPNIQFFRSMRFVMSVANCSRDVLLLELDAYPLRKNWLTELNARTLWLKNSVFVAGSHPAWVETSGLIRTHVNGNAIYFTSNKDFPEFLSEWERLLLDAIPINYDLAYDAVMAWAYHFSKLNSMENAALCRWKELMDHEYRYRVIDITSQLINIGHLSSVDGFDNKLREILCQNTDLLIIHGKYIENKKDLIREFFSKSIDML